MSRIEFVPYPPTSFPLRDLLVLEQLPLGAEDRVCEIGVGSGGTTARLARLCRRIAGFDVSGEAIDAIRYLEERHRNLELVVRDVTDVAALGPYEGKFTRLVSCDTLEHVPAPAAFFRAVKKLLAPGGSFMITFPNEPAARMHGVTRFDAANDLRALLRSAGLPDHRVGAAVMRPGTERIARNLGQRPLQLVRWLLGRGRGGPNGPGGAAPPQTFEQTGFFENRRLWRRLSPLVNLYWYAVLRLVDAPAFEIDWDFRTATFTDCQVLIAGSAPPACDV